MVGYGGLSDFEELVGGQSQEMIGFVLGRIIRILLHREYLRGSQPLMLISLYKFDFIINLPPYLPPNDRLW